MYNLAKNNPYEMNLLKSAIDLELDANPHQFRASGKIYNILSNMSDKNKSLIVDAIYGTGDNTTIPILIVENCKDSRIESYESLANRASLLTALKIKNIRKLYRMKYVESHIKVSQEEYELAKSDLMKHTMTAVAEDGSTEYYVGDVLYVFEQGNYDCFDLVINPFTETIECLIMKANGKLPYKGIMALIKADRGEVVGIDAELTGNYSSWLYPSYSTLLCYGMGAV